MRNILDHLAKPASPIALLGETSRSNFEIVTVARDGVLKLRDTTGQAVSLCALLDDDLVVLDLMHGRSVVEFTTRPILVGSIAIAGSTQVIAPKPVPAQLGAVLKAAREVSRDLGWKGQQ